MMLTVSSPRPGLPSAIGHMQSAPVPGGTYALPRPALLGTRSALAQAYEAPVDAR